MNIELDLTPILGYKTIEEFRQARAPLAGYSAYDDGIYAIKSDPETYVIVGTAVRHRWSIGDKFMPVFSFEMTVTNLSGKRESLMVRFIGAEYEQNKYVFSESFSGKKNRVIVKCGKPEDGTTPYGRPQKMYPGYEIIVRK